MDIIKKVITIAIFVFSYSHVQAQYHKQHSPAQELEYHQKWIKSTVFIFEGTVTAQESYLTKEGRKLTCNIVQITKIFKGSPQIKLGSIKVITLGGEIEDGGVTISKDRKFIIFCQPAYSYMLIDKMVTTDNSVTLTTVDCVAPIVFNDKIYRHGKEIHLDRPDAQWDQTQFKTSDDVYAHLKENGLIVQEEAAQSKQSTSPVDGTKQKNRNKEIQKK